MQTPEGAIQDAILGYLQAVRIVAFRQNTGMMTAEGKNGKKRFIHFGVVGMADILALPTISGIHNGSRIEWTAPVFIEIKSPTGKQSQEQKSFERQVKDAGAYYFVARSVEDVKLWLLDNGASIPR